jgi:hypothetical protein
VTSPMRFILLCLACFSLTACFTTTPLVSPMEAPLNGQYSLKEIDTAMQKAATELGWTLDKADQGFLGTLRIREHVVVVHFKRDQQHLAAYYKSSENLRYDEKNIHKKYHIWIDSFFKTFRTNLAATPTKG